MSEPEQPASELPGETVGMPPRGPADPSPPALEARAAKRAFVTPTLVAINVIVFVAMGLSGVSWIQPDAEQLIPWGADWAPLTTHGQWWRLLTSGFLHFGLLHIALNMWALLSVGMVAERLFGRRFYAGIYLFGILMSALAATCWDPEAVEAGASGAIFAVYGAFLAYLKLNSSSFPKDQAKKLIKSTLVFVGYNVFYGLATPGISNAAHLGGLASGLVMGAILARPLVPVLRDAQFRPRLVKGLVVGVISLAAAFVLVPRYHGDAAANMEFQTALNAFVAKEDSSLSRYNALVDESHAGKIKDAAFAEGIEREVIPAWAEMVARLSAIKMGDSSRLKPLYDKMSRYCQLRLDALTALHQSLQDKTPTTRYQQLWDQAEAIVVEIKQDGEKKK